MEKDVDRAILEDPATELLEIETSVKDGVVALSGSVDSWKEKQLASKVVKGVKGVKGVKNNLSIDYTTERSDVEIQHEIEKALRWDPSTI
ncbi:MAG: BON domain-containing protein [Desulfobacterales bacterium]